jgi:solute carrier family 10 (sodium/bile acid cotransporter), member 7
MNLIARLNIDPYILAIAGTVGVASVLPAHGTGAVVAGHASQAGIAVLFFLHGAKLAPRAALAGAKHAKLHAAVLLSTFVLFPALGLAARAALPHLLPPALWDGLILLCILPSTVQSSIAFTSIAHGNVPAALCAATASNLFGMVLTPLLAGLLLSTHGGFSAHALGDIALQLLLPFAAGQFARPWIGDLVGRHRAIVGGVDRGSILMVVYVAFSEGVTHGIWHQVDVATLLTLVGVDAALLAAVLSLTTLAARLLGLSRANEIALVFCGSKKSLASGLPMATVLLAGRPVGLIVLPLMLFHQIQLMACAALARRHGAQLAATGSGPVAVPVQAG